MARTYTDEQKAQARHLYETEGLAAATAATDIPKGTISAWVSKEGWQTCAPAKTRAAIEARLAKLEAERQTLAIGLLDDIAQLREQLFAPCVERKIVTVGGSRDSSGYWELVDIDRARPTFVDQKAIMTSVAIAVDKVQVLTGEPTAITETREVPDRTPEQEAEMAKVVSLAERRAA